MSAEDTQRLRRTFVAWSPPPGAELVSHYHFARGGSGIVILQASEATAVFSAMAPFGPGINFDVEPVVNVLDALALKMDADDWIESIDSNVKGEGRAE